MSEVFKIFISRPDLPRSALSLLSDYDLDVWNERVNVPREIFLKRISGKDALLITSHDRIDSEALDAAGDKLKVIGTTSAGYDHIDVKEVKKRGIKLGYAADVLRDAVADLAIGLIISTTRRFFEAHKQILEGKWKEWSPWDWMNGFGLRNSVVGIFGLGKIGMEIARRLVPFGPSKILYVSRTRKKEQAEEVKATRVSLDNLLKDSDIVILSCSLNDETKGIMNDERFNMMKETSFLVNVARGDLVDQEALIRALKEKRIRGAALDVVNPEPLPPNHPLLSLDNCTIVPHIGSAEIKTRIAMAELTSMNIKAGLNGEPLPLEI